jgi:acetyl esterase/lipase
MTVSTNRQMYRLPQGLRYWFCGIFISSGYFYSVNAFGVEDRHSMFSVSNSVGDLVEHPLLAGFSERLLPRLTDAKQRSLHLDQVGKLMPYHSAFNPEDMVGALNRLITLRQQGQRVFYDYYSEPELNRSPDKRVTGLVYYKSKPNAPFVIVVPGGGFEYVGSLHEGFPIAKAIGDLGINAFVLVYRTGQGNRVATEDLAHAVDYITEHADEFEVNKDHYAVWGASAGARMVANIGSKSPLAFGGRTNQRPDCVVMLYTGHTSYTPNDPPTYAVVGERDWIASPDVMRTRINVLRALGIRAEFHEYPNIGHGFALGTGTSAQGWLNEALDFCWSEFNGGQ